MELINVSWNDIKEYTDWLTRKTGKQYRLPSELEWEWVEDCATPSYYIYFSRWFTFHYKKLHDSSAIRCFCNPTVTNNQIVKPVPLN